ncbi:MAG: primosomal protein N' [Sphaerochaetaceae bacterium]
MYASVLLDRPLKRSFIYEIPEGMDVAVGMRVRVMFSHRELTGYVCALSDRADAAFRILPVKRVIDKEPVFGRNEIDLADWMGRFYLCSQGEAISLMIPGGKKDSGIPALDVEEDPLTDRVDELTFEQKAAIAKITSETYGMYYLYGVTGSGKSEVFLRSAEAVIARGRQVIYLVPEITLTHQLARLVTKRFGGRVAILHSALTESQRMTQWKRIKRGEVDLVIGARSAVFAPADKLGMIIIDEEHENSYKADQTPRYHARQVAQWRCHNQNALLVMGSATPSLEAWKMSQEGKLTMLVLPRRVAGGTLPRIRVVDMKGSKDLFSEELKEEMHRVLDAKKQVVLFLNRRGFSSYFHCRSCGYEMQCPHCSVSLTYHKEKNEMVCHYCGYHTRPVHVCPKCRSLDVGYSGFGTEMVEDEVKTLFPAATIARLDADAVLDKKAMGPVLEDFRMGKTDILLGTQMVAKGLNFPGVELVGIVMADSGMNIPDFRSQERTFSLLTQVSGRAGRYSDKGRVIIQTYHPDNAAIVAVQEGDLYGFYAAEMENRKMTGFPPYSRLVNLVVRGHVEAKVIKACDELGTIIDSLIPTIVAKGSLELMCNSECPVEKKREYHRHHLLLRSEDASAVQVLAARALASYKPPQGIYIEVDIDPLQML